MKFSTLVMVSETGQIQARSGRLPKLRDGASVELVFHRDDLAGKEEQAYWSKPQSIVVPTKHGIILGFNKVSANFERIPFYKPSENEPIMGMYRHFVLVQPKSTLRIISRVGERLKMASCTIQLPAGLKDAISLNHAYSVLSEWLEPDRRSHTSNIFKSAFYYEENAWYKLGRLRGD